MATQPQIFASVSESDWPNCYQPRADVAIAADFVLDPYCQLEDSPELSWALSISPAGQVTQWVQNYFMRKGCRVYRASIEKQLVLKLLHLAQGIHFYDLQKLFDYCGFGHTWLTIAVHNGSRFNRVQIYGPQFHFRHACDYGESLVNLRRFWKCVVDFAPMQTMDGLLH